MNTHYRILLFSYNPEDVMMFQKIINDNMLENIMVPCELKICDGYSALSKCIFNGERYDIYFLDYENEFSLPLARMFANIGIHEPIVFITSNPICRSSAYNIKLLDYMFRPIDMSILKELLIYNYCNNTLTDKVLLNKKSNSFYLNPSNIVYIEVYGHGIKIYLSDLFELEILSHQLDLKNDINLKEKSVFYSETISKFKNRLNPVLFIQCHQSFIINLLKVVSIRRYSAILENSTNNGAIVNISKSKYNEVKNSFIQIDDKKIQKLLDSELGLIAGGQTYNFIKK